MFQARAGIIGLSRSSYLDLVTHDWLRCDLLDELGIPICYTPGEMQLRSSHYAGGIKREV